MQNFIFSENTVELFRYIQQRFPKRIFINEFYRVVFDYKESHITGNLNEVKAASQNDSDLVRKIDFDKFNSVFVPDEFDELVIESPSVNRIWILRTLIYFTDHVVYKSKEEALARVDGERDEAVKEIIANSTGGHETIVCHPKSQEAEKVNKEVANLVDAGVLLAVDDNYFGCFSLYNSFSIEGETSLKEIEDIAPHYEFIEVNGDR